MKFTSRSSVPNFTISVQQNAHNSFKGRQNGGQALLFASASADAVLMQESVDAR